MASKIKKGDLVQVITGAKAERGGDRGKQGKVLRVFTDTNRVLVEGVNRVTLDNDPTAHAEVVAIRAAATAIGNYDLQGAVLYASCEPCPLCLASALWARIDRVYFAADRHGAAAAGFDDAVFYEYFDGTRPELLPVTRSDIPSSHAPFQAWGDFAGRKEY